jgi:hypothetical protein
MIWGPLICVYLCIDVFEGRIGWKSRLFHVYKGGDGLVAIRWQKVKVCFKITKRDFIVLF